MSARRWVCFFVTLQLFALLAAFGYAREAPPGMRVFNRSCPAPLLCSRMNDEMETCRSSGKRCASFLSDYRKLLPEYDCQRPFDHTPAKDYIVPAVWLCERNEDYVQFLSKMKSKEARRLFGSPELRNSLDGALAEDYYDASLAAGRGAGKRRR